MLGDKKGRFDSACAYSEDEVELTCRIGGSTDSLAAGNLPRTGESEDSVIIFPWLEDEGSYKGALIDTSSNFSDILTSVECRALVGHPQKGKAKHKNVARRIFMQQPF